MVSLFPHQKQSLKQTKTLNRVAYYHDMGLGKTFTGTEKLNCLGAEINLIVCQKSKISDWIAHLGNYEMSVYDLTKKDQLTWFTEEKGLYKRKTGVINYDMVWRRQELLELENFTLMLDESSLIQNDRAKRSKFILKMKPKNVILLSGTPTSGKYENLWSQAHLLGWSISQELYNRHYINWISQDIGGKVIRKVDKKNPYKNIERLKNKLREHGAVFLKTEDVINLPEQNYIRIHVNTSKIYNQFQIHSIVKVDSDTTLVGDTILAKRLYLRQLCGQYHEDKLQAFTDLISSTQDRLIVFYNFDKELELLKQIAEQLDKPISEVNGHAKNLLAYETEDNSITFVQYQAGSKGLNLQKTNKIIYFTPTEKCEDWMQSQKRIHRIGQNQPCFYYLLITKNSIEEDVYNTLEKGVDYTEELFREYERNR